MYRYTINHVKLDQHNINSNETLYYSFTLSVNKLGEVEILLMNHMFEYVFQIR